MGVLALLVATLGAGIAAVAASGSWRQRAPHLVMGAAMVISMGSSAWSGSGGMSMADGATGLAQAVAPSTLVACALLCCTTLVSGGRLLTPSRGHRTEFLHGLDSAVMAAALLAPALRVTAGVQVAALVLYAVARLAAAAAWARPSAGPPARPPAGGQEPAPHRGLVVEAGAATMFAAMVVMALT